jgi:hypothetical protein
MHELMSSFFEGWNLEFCIGKLVHWIAPNIEMKFLLIKKNWWISYEKLLIYICNGTNNSMGCTMVWEIVVWQEKTNKVFCLMHGHCKLQQMWDGVNEISWATPTSPLGDCLCLFCNVLKIFWTICFQNSWKILKFFITLLCYGLQPNFV